MTWCSLQTQKQVSEKPSAVGHALLYTCKLMEHGSLLQMQTQTQASETFHSGARPNAAAQALLHKHCCTSAVA